MRSSKFKVEFFDEDGSRFTISIEGVLSRKKIMQLLDMLELMGSLDSRVEEKEASTKFERIKNLIKNDFQETWFSSRDIKFAYEEEYGENIPMSTISTYLQRLYKTGFLMRKQSGNNRIYHINYIALKEA